MNQEFWERNAKPWHQAIESDLIESRKITNPAIVQRILRRKPRTVLDLGCGDGWIASEISSAGAEYVGLDFSTALIEMARDTHPDGKFEAVSYDDLVQGAWKNSETFDLVVFNFSLFEEDPRPLLRRAATFLEPTGRVLIQTLHPCFALSPYEDGWKSEDFKTFPIPFSGTMAWYGRTLGSWLSVLSESGLRLNEVCEPSNPVTKVPASLILVAESEK